MNCLHGLDIRVATTTRNSGSHGRLSRSRRQRPKAKGIWSRGRPAAKHRFTICWWVTVEACPSVTSFKHVFNKSLFVYYLGDAPALGRVIKAIPLVKLRVVQVLGSVRAALCKSTHIVDDWVADCIPQHDLTFQNLLMFYCCFLMLFTAHSSLPYWNIVLYAAAFCWRLCADDHLSSANMEGGQTWKIQSGPWPFHIQMPVAL